MNPYRHIYAEFSKGDKNYLECNVSTTSVDSNLLAANYRYVAFPEQTEGGGLFTVLNVNGKGKIGTTAPGFVGHAGAVVDLAFNPFNDNMIASAAEDATLRLWKIEMEGEQVKPNREPLTIMKGHGRRCQRIAWSPTVNGVIATFGAENSIKVWDVSKSTAFQTYKPGKDQILDIAWDSYGKLLYFPSKDKKLHCFDPRANAETFAVPSHEGVRGSRVACYGKLNYVFTTGFNRSSNRQVKVRDPRNPEKDLVTQDVDQNNSILAPFIDQDLGIVFLFGRGDSTIYAYSMESEEKPLVELSKSASSEPVKAFCQAPKYCVDTTICEVDRCYIINAKRELVKTQLIVPRKNAEIFQDDLFPETVVPEPSIEFEAWKNGDEVPEPKRFSLENGFTPADGPALQVEAAHEETIESLKAENEKLKARIAELEAQLAAK